MEETILDKPWNYTLISESNKYFLSVLCGTVGMFEVKIELTEEEEKSYVKKGAEYIDKLADQIRNNPGEYNKRDINIKNK